jgi:hypothetical protein
MAVTAAVAEVINHLQRRRTGLEAILIKKATSLRFAKPPVYRCRAL